MDATQNRVVGDAPVDRPPVDEVGSSAGSFRLHEVLQDEIQKRQQADDALRLAEHRYQSIFEHALEGIFQTSGEGQYIAANPALMKMYGYESFEELAAAVNNIATKLYVDPARRAEFVRLMRENGQVLHFESEVRRRDGDDDLDFGKRPVDPRRRGQLSLLRGHGGRHHRAEAGARKAGADAAAAGE